MQQEAGSMKHSIDKSGAHGVLLQGAKRKYLGTGETKAQAEREAQRQRRVIEGRKA